MIKVKTSLEVKNELPEPIMIIQGKKISSIP